MDRQLIIDYKQTFQSPQGERVLNNLKELAKYRVSYWPNGMDGHTDIYEVCREEGKRAVINHILIMLEKNPDKLQTDMVNKKDKGI